MPILSANSLAKLICLKKGILTSSNQTKNELNEGKYGAEKLGKRKIIGQKLGILESSKVNLLIKILFFQFFYYLLSSSNKICSGHFNFDAVHVDGIELENSRPVTMPEEYFAQFFADCIGL